MSTFDLDPTGFNPEDWQPVGDNASRALCGHVDNALILPQTVLTVTREAALPLADLRVEMITSHEYVGIERRRSVSEFQAMFLPATEDDGTSESDEGYVNVTYNSVDGCSVDVNGEIDDDTDSLASRELCFFAGQTIRSLMRLDAQPGFIFIPELADQYDSLHSGVATILGSSLEDLVELAEGFNTPEDMLNDIKGLPDEIMKLLRISKMGNLGINRYIQLDIEGDGQVTLSHITSTLYSTTMGQDKLVYRRVHTPSGRKLRNRGGVPYVDNSYIIIKDNEPPSVVTEIKLEDIFAVKGQQPKNVFDDPVIDIVTRPAVRADFARIEPEFAQLTALYGI
jgi:hypothetical protein